MGFPVINADTGEKVLVEKVSNGTEQDVLIDGEGNEYAKTDQLGFVKLTATAAPAAVEDEPEAEQNGDEPLPSAYQGEQPQPPSLEEQAAEGTDASWTDGVDPLNFSADDAGAAAFEAAVKDGSPGAETLPE